MTAAVFDEGGFGVTLVVKPYPSWLISVGGGEEGAWQRHHPGEPLPWWLREDDIPIIQDDWEGGLPWWVRIYFLGSLAELIGWPALVGVWIVRCLWKRRHVRRARRPCGDRGASRGGTGGHRLPSSFSCLFGGEPL